MANTDILHSIYGKIFGVDYQYAAYSPGGFRTSVTNGTTAVGAPSAGMMALTSTAGGTYPIPAPQPGWLLDIIATTTSTAIKACTLVSGAIVSTGGSTFVTASFDGIGEAISLVGLSTSAWACRSAPTATLS